MARKTPIEIEGLSQLLGINASNVSRRYDAAAIRLRKDDVLVELTEAFQQEYDRRIAISQA